MQRKQTRMIGRLEKQRQSGRQLRIKKRKAAAKDAREAEDAVAIRKAAEDAKKAEKSYKRWKARGLLSHGKQLDIIPDPQGVRTHDRRNLVRNRININELVGTARSANHHVGV